MELNQPLTCKSFTDLLAPISLDTFFQAYWEQQPLHVVRQQNDYYAGLLQLEDLEPLIASINLERHSLQVAKKTPQENTQQFITQPLGMWNTLYNSYASGHTIALFCIEHQLPHLGNFFKSLEIALGCIVSGSVYASPEAEVTGFRCHADTDDVYVLQLEGAKHWSLWSAQYLLPQDQTTRPEIDVIQLGQPFLEVDLMPGDLLYIPRGIIHQAVSVDGPSLHLSLTPDAVPWSDLLFQAFSLVVQEDVAFRHSLPRGIFTLDEAELEGEFLQLIQRLIAQVRFKPALEQLRSNILARISPVPDGHLRQLQQLSQLQADTLLCKRTQSLHQVTVDLPTAQVLLHFPGNVVAAPVALEPLLRSITAQDWFTARSLPTPFPLPTKLEVVRHLVREGFLRQASAAEKAEVKPLWENVANENLCSSAGGVPVDPRDAAFTP